ARDRRRVGPGGRADGARGHRGRRRRRVGDDARAGAAAGGAARSAPDARARGHARPARAGVVPARDGAVPRLPAPVRRRRAAGRPAGAARPAPARLDVAETHGRWIEREPGIDERALWDEDARRLELTVRAGDVHAEMQLWWIEPHRLRALLDEAGFEKVRGYGWFDRRPLEPDATDSVWTARRPAASLGS